MGYKIDRKQFYITNGTQGYKDFELIKFGNCNIFHDKELNISRCIDKSGEQWYFLGDAYSCKENGENPLDDITNAANQAEVLAASIYWGGRWLLINSHIIYNDACGLMGLYFHEKDGSWIISSSLHVISELNDNLKQQRPTKVSAHDQFHSYPAPGSVLADVRKTLPSQCIEYTKDKIQLLFQNKFDFSFKNLKFEEKNEKLAKYIGTIVTNVIDSGKDVYIPLTGGYDSRVLFGAAITSRKRFMAYTMHHENIAKGDREIPQKLSNQYGIEYQYIRPINKRDKEALKAWYHHTCFSIEETDREFLTRGQFNVIAPGSIVLKGGILDMIRGSSYPKFESSLNLLEYLKKMSPRNDEYDNYHTLINEWIDWTDLHPLPIDIRDRFCIEYHLGGWLANLQQFADMLDSTYIQVCNCGAIVSLILSYSEAERKSKIIYYGLYDSFSPFLSEYEVNPIDRWAKLRYYYNVLKQNPAMALKKLLRR